MLERLHVKNLALIEEAEVNFREGLNILTGETGAGKSIIIGSVNYALGAKADADVIRSGAEYALVELVFYLEQEEKRRLVREMDFALEEDGTLIISRKIMPGRSIIRVGGETVTVKQVKELASILIDIHGQHEHQSLLKPKKQLDLLDDFAGEKAMEWKASVAKEYKEYKDLLAELDALDMDEGAREREVSLARYEVDEIEGAGICLGEEIELQNKYRKMQNGKKIVDALQKVSMYLDAGDGNAVELTGYALRELSNAAGMDEELTPMEERLRDVESLLADVSRDIKNYAEDFSFSEEEFDETEKRLDILNHLMTKYGNSTEKILAYGEKRRKELDQLMDLANVQMNLKNRLSQKEEEIRKICRQLHELRSIQATALSEEITAVLEDLNFLRVTFEIAVTEKDSFGENGADEVCFLISLNPGEAKKPVAEVASGGELSRIMLALKTVFARKDRMETLIFDEIDAGISGKTAWRVSERMDALGKGHQILCITHLPQIAAMADRHYLIDKKEEDGVTKTEIRELDAGESVEEVARLLGSDMVTDAVLENAKELISMAKMTKEKKI